MNVLYYCQEYHRAFGPSTHAREFFAELQKIPGSGKCKVIPEKGVLKSVQRSSVTASEATIKRKLARILLPKWIRLIILFLFPKKSVWEMLDRELSSGDWGAVVIRPDWALMWVPKLKRAFPHVTILLEINSAMFDEGFEGIPFRWYWKRVEARAINAADQVTTVSENLKEYLVRHGVRAEKIYANPNGVNLSQFNPGLFGAEDKNGVKDSFCIPRDSTLFGYVGGMQPFRRLPEMVKLFAELIDSDQLNASLLLIGDGEDMEAVSEMRSRFPENVQERIIIAGSKPYSEIPQIVSAFDVAVFPFSNPYGSPQKLFEYMAMGIPVLGPKVPVVEETFKGGEHLVLIEQSNDDSFTTALLRCIESPDVLQAMAKSGQEYVMREYTWQKNAERVFALLEQNA